MTNTFSNIDVNPKLHGRARLFDMILKQQRWIEECEANGVSYAGKNGHAIRRADQAELSRLESQLPHTK